MAKVEPPRFPLIRWGPPERGGGRRSDRKVKGYVVRVYFDSDCTHVERGKEGKAVVHWWMIGESCEVEKE